MAGLTQPLDPHGDEPTLEEQTERLVNQLHQAHDNLLQLQPGGSPRQTDPIPIAPGLISMLREASRITEDVLSVSAAVFKIVGKL